MSVNEHIHNVISDYLAGNLDSNAFVLKFAEVSYNLHKHADGETLELRNKISSKMADVRAGHLSESEFRTWLTSLTTMTANRIYAGPVLFANPINRPVEVELASPSAFESFGTSPEVVFGLTTLAQQ